MWFWYMECVHLQCVAYDMECITMWNGMQSVAWREWIHWEQHTSIILFHLRVLRLRHHKWVESQGLITNITPVGLWFCTNLNFFSTNYVCFWFWFIDNIHVFQSLNLGWPQCCFFMSQKSCCNHQKSCTKTNLKLNQSYLQKKRSFWFIIMARLQKGHCRSLTDLFQWFAFDKEFIRHCHWVQAQSGAC